MLEVYAVLILAGLCVLLVIWIHGVHMRRSRPAPGGRESVAPVKPLYAHRAADDPGYVELKRLSRDCGLQTYRIEDVELPREELTFNRPHQMEILFKTSGETLLMILHVTFSAPCPGKALHDFLVGAGLKISEDGLYRKPQEQGRHTTPSYYVASHSPTGSFTEQGRLIEVLHRVTFFTQLPLPADSMSALNGMIRLAREVCEKFRGLLLDEDEKPMGREAIEAMVQKARAFLVTHSDLDTALAH